MTILSYNANPSPRYKQTKEQAGVQNLPYLGFEVEVLKRPLRERNTHDYAAECAQYLADNYPHVYCKHDASIVRGGGDASECIGGAGFEVVTHPFTYEWMKANPHSLDWVDFLKKKKFVSWQADTCALHVHVSKNSISKPDLYKMYKFFQLHDEFLYKIAGRHGEWLNRYASIDKIKGCSAQQLTAYANDIWPDKYVALRNNKPHTIEVRIFRGTLSKEGICRALEFVLALRQFCIDHATKDLTNLGTFFKYVNANITQYNHLHKWLKSNNYI